MDIKFIKELGSGGNGTVYLIESNKQKLIYKLERLDIYNKNTPLQSEYYRQIEFNEDIAKYYPDKFMTLLSYGVILNCLYKHPKHEELIKKYFGDRLRRYIRKNSQPNCYFLIYKPYLDGSYRDIRDKIKKNPKLFLDFMYQIISSLNILRKKGYVHNDTNLDNIMYKKNHNKYQWYLIDYGNICNKKFPISELDKDIGVRLLNCKDMIKFISICITPDIKYFSDKYLVDYPFNMDIYMKNLKKAAIFPNVAKYVIKYKKNKIYKTLLAYITMILYPKIHFKCMGVPENIYKKYNGKQLFPSLLVYSLQHQNDKNYDNILKKIKKLQS